VHGQIETEPQGKSLTTTYLYDSQGKHVSTSEVSYDEERGEFRSTTFGFDNNGTWRLLSQEEADELRLATTPDATPAPAEHDLAGVDAKARVPS
jgi:hypothetical protein